MDFDSKERLRAILRDTISINKHKDRLINWLITYLGEHMCVQGIPPTPICPSKEACKQCWIKEAQKGIVND